MAEATQTATQASWPAHDPGTRRWLPTTSRPIDPSRVEQLMAAEWERFTSTTAALG